MFPVAHIAADELAAALPYLLAGPADALRAVAPTVRSFAQYLAVCAIPWDGWRCGSIRAPQGVAAVLHLPGRTAVLMPAVPGCHGITADAQQAVLAAALTALRRRAPHFAQVLADPAATSLHPLLTAAGFRLVTRLVYLERDALYPWTEPVDPRGVRWRSYDAALHARFATVVQSTYFASADCPELTGLRPIDDALAAHRASGGFDPALWELAECDGVSVGCLLLARALHGGALEVAYMGVVPAWRGRGVGGWLLRRALDHCRVARVARLALVVDARNTPARRLYERFDLAPVGERDAFLLPLGGAAPADNL